MTMQPVRVGIVGAGANTRVKHIPGLHALDGVQIVSVSNRSRASSERVALQFGIPTVYDDWLELVEAPDTDAIVIGTWPYMHAPVTLAALDAGKHVLCEARMARNADEAHIMLDAARANPHLITQVVASPFTLSVDRTVKRLLAEGYVGDVLAIDIRSSTGFIDAGAPLHWRHDMELSGFNVMSLGIWYESILRWVGHATRVAAMGKTFVKMRRDPASDALRSVRIPDHLDVLADLECGAQLHIGLSNVAGLAGDDELFLYGSEGTLRFASDRLYGGRRGDDRLAEIAIPAEEAGGWRVEEEFINAIRGIEPVTHTTFFDGVRYMEFTEAVTRSIMEGVAIALPL
jgi:predicted dehydrogenase